MSFKNVCYNCAARIRMADEYDGRIFKCPRCKAVLQAKKPTEDGFPIPSPLDDLKAAVAQIRSAEAHESSRPQFEPFAPEASGDYYLEFAGDGDFELDVVGESYYQTHLEKICGGRCRDGVELKTIATIILQDDNPFDDKAVQIKVNDLPVGHLSRDDARLFRRWLKRNDHTGSSFRCNAMIVGGWVRGEGNRGHFGIRLDVKG